MSDTAADVEWSIRRGSNIHSSASHWVVYRTLASGYRHYIAGRDGTPKRFRSEAAAWAAIPNDMRTEPRHE